MRPHVPVRYSGLGLAAGGSGAAPFGASGRVPYDQHQHQHQQQALYPTPSHLPFYRGVGPGGSGIGGTMGAGGGSNAALQRPRGSHERRA